MKKTDELLKILKDSKDYSTYKNLSEDSIIPENVLSEYLCYVLEKKGIKKSEVIRQSGMDRGYAYDIFSGKKQPSRDKLLMICIGAGMNFEETQILLKHTGYPLLYPRIERDSVLIYSMEHNLTVINTNILLHEMNQKPLE